MKKPYGELAELVAQSAKIPSPDSEYIFLYLVLFNSFIFSNSLPRSPTPTLTLELERQSGDLRGWWDRFTKQPLHKDTINLYAVADWIIKPFTAKEACSFVELVVDEGTSEQIPQWFISHWWGEAVLAFIRAVEAHAKARGLEASAAYWVCAYANNQHAMTI